jgi:hypothetical protein
MKLLRVLLATGSLLIAYSSLQAVDSVSPTARPAWQWVTNYYQNPRPDDLLPALYSLSRSGYFESVGQPATALGFFTTVFAQNPQQVNYWLAQASGLPEQHRRILAAAAWKSGSATGARLLREMAAGENDPLRNEVHQLLINGSEPLGNTPVLSASSMNLQWGAFLASGDDRHIVSVLTALGSGQPGLASSARFALAQNAVAHPRVLEICRAQLDKQPESVRSELKAALNAATANRPGA